MNLIQLKRSQSGCAGMAATCMQLAGPTGADVGLTTPKTPQV